MGHVVANPRGWRPKRTIPAHKPFDGAVCLAPSRRWQPCVPTHIIEDDQHIQKSVRSVNAGVHRTLPLLREVQKAQLRSAFAHERLPPTYGALTLPPWCSHNTGRAESRLARNEACPPTHGAAQTEPLSNRPRCGRPPPGVHTPVVIFQRVGTGRDPENSVAMVFHLVQPFRVERSHLQRGIEGGPALRSSSLHDEHLIRRKHAAPCARAPPAAIELPIAFSWCPTLTTAAQCSPTSEKYVVDVKQ